MNMVNYSYKFICQYKLQHKKIDNIIRTHEMQHLSLQCNA